MLPFNRAVVTVPGALVPNISGSYYTIIALFSNIVLPYIVYNISEIKKLNTNCIVLFPILYWQNHQYFQSHKYFMLSIKSDCFRHVYPLSAFIKTKDAKFVMRLTIYNIFCHLLYAYCQ